MQAGRVMKCFLATVLLTLCAATANAAIIHYDVNRTIGDGTVTGFIETYGKLGVLSKDDIHDWSLTLTAPNINLGSPDTITNGDTFLRGTAVSATSTQLLYNFDITGTNYLYLAGASGNFWCLETNTCIDDGSEQIELIEQIGHNDNGGKVAQFVHHTGTIAFANAAVIPVPAAVWLFGSGLIGLIGFAWRKR